MELIHEIPASKLDIIERSKKLTAGQRFEVISILKNGGIEKMDVKNTFARHSDRYFELQKRNIIDMQFDIEKEEVTIAITNKFKNWISE